MPLALVCSNVCGPQCHRADLTHFRSRQLRSLRCHSRPMVPHSGCDGSQRLTQSYPKAFREGQSACESQTHSARVVGEPTNDFHRANPSAARQFRPIRKLAANDSVAPAGRNQKLETVTLRGSRWQPHLAIRLFRTRAGSDDDPGPFRDVIRAARFDPAARAAAGPILFSLHTLPDLL